MKILIAGDFCPQHRVAEKFEQGDYEYVLGGAKDVIARADYSIVNFECPITKDGEKPIMKCGPNHHCSEKGMEAVKWAGFDCATLANNHFKDYGKEGVENTLALCSKYGVDSVGGGVNLHDAAKTLYKEVGGEKLAIINCCEHEFSIATDSTAGSNPLNPIQQYYSIQEAKTLADYVLVIVHGGHEHYQLPSPRMQETYRFFIDAGADAVVNHHQHCYSGYEVYKGKPIFYGLGNFCFDKKGKRNSKWNEGYMVEMDFKSSMVKYKIITYNQCNTEPKVELCDLTNPNMIMELNSIIENENMLQKSYKSFVLETKDNYLLVMEPYVGRWGGLRKRKIVPSLLSNVFFMRLYGYLLCESHLDRIMLILKDIINNGQNR